MIWGLSLVEQRVGEGEHFDPGLPAVELDLVPLGVEEADAGELVGLGPGAGDRHAVLKDHGLAGAGGLILQGDVPSPAERTDVTATATFLAWIRLPERPSAWGVPPWLRR